MPDISDNKDSIKLTRYKLKGNRFDDRLLPKIFHPKPIPPFQQENLQKKVDAFRDDLCKFSMKF